MSYTHATLYPIIAMVRGWERWRGGGTAASSEGDLEVPATPVNAVLSAALAVESACAAAGRPAVRQHRDGAGAEAEMTGDPATTRWARSAIGGLVGASAWVSAGTLAALHPTTGARVATLPGVVWLAAAVVAGAAAGAVRAPCDAGSLAPLALLGAPVAAVAARAACRRPS